jgi:DNA polymerase-3 subunit delta
VKISGRTVAAFLRQPDPACVAVLVYGPDRGLVRERADGLAATVVDDLDDPFRVTTLTGDGLAADPARLADEAAALSLSGGRRLLRIRDGVDSSAKIFDALLSGADVAAFIVVEAADLGPRSSLRRVFEKAANAAALACYVDDDRALRQVVAEALGAHGQTPSSAAMAYLVGNLGSDRMVTRNELEKLALYVGRPGAVELDDVLACIGDNAAASLDDVVFATAGGDGIALDRALRRALLEGNHPVAILRAVARHLQRLHLASGQIAAGKTPQQAMAGLRPPVFFKFTKAFLAQAHGWPVSRLGDALEAVTGAEMDCKTTGMPVEAVCGRALMRVAQMAARHVSARA